MTGDTPGLSTQELFGQAMAHCQAGDIASAEPILLEVLASDPTHFQAICNLGVILCQKGDARGAEHLFNEALKLSPCHEQTLNNLGHSLMLQSKASEANIVFKEATRLYPDSGTGFHNLASAALSLQNWEQAKVALQKVLALSPGDAAALRGLGLAYAGEGSQELAEKSFREAVESEPGNPENWYGLGNTYLDRRQFVEAKACFSKVMELVPRHKDAATNLAQTLLGLEEYEVARPFLESLVLEYPGEWRNWISLGQILCAKLDLPRAIEAFEKAVQLAPGQWECWNSLGVAYNETGNFQKATELLEKALELEPQAADAHWNLSLTLLCRGDFERGWQEYHWRWRRESFTSRWPKTSSKKWKGEEGDLCLHTEQGYGDNIQFIRLARLARQACKGKVKVFSESPLVRLFSDIKGVDEASPKCEGWEKELDEFAYHLPLMDLPLVLGGKAMDPVGQGPYIQPDGHETREWEQCLGAHLPKGIRAGIVWEANPNNKKGTKRSIPESVVYPWLARFGDHCSFLCLQPERAGEDLRQENVKNLFFLPRPPKDFMETAAILSSLDFVITVDTAISHLSGACGIETYLLLYATPCWRWLNGDSPDLWYPGMEIFKQGKIGDWSHPLSMLEIRLTQKFVQARNGL
jgi:Flp pilus assembly protein TadD